MRLTLLRHGRTVANAGGLLQGRSDNPLDAQGHAQAVAAAAVLGTVDRVISSPLVRAVETATAISPTFEIDDRWIELDYGEWDQRRFAEVPSSVWSEWRTNLDLRPPGGETLRELGVRVRAALTELAAAEEADPGAHVVIVTHVSPIKAAVAWALGSGDEIGWRTRLSTGSISQIDIGDGRAALVGFNIVPS